MIPQRHTAAAVLAPLLAVTVVVRASVWTTQTVHTAPSSFFATSLAHLPDGRFVLGFQGQIFVQNALGSPAKTAVATGALSLDPSFVAVASATSALAGAGGFGGASGLHGFNASSPASGVTVTPLASLQNYNGVFWRSPAPGGPEGWIIGGGNGAGGMHNLTFVSLDGSRIGALTGTISTYSGGLAVDAAGNVYAATYELDPFFNPTPDANKVYGFSVASIEARVQAILAGNTTPVPVPLASATFLHRFDGTASLAVDSLGRVWAAGFGEMNHLQVFDPASAVMSRVVPDHPSYAAGTEVMYTVRSATLGGAGQVAFLVQDEWGSAGTALHSGMAPDAALVIPQQDVWRAARFGVHNLPLETRTTIWGDDADPDRDGVKNLLEYAFDLDPLAADGAGAVTTATSGGLLAITFPRHPGRTDLKYEIEASSTPAGGSWNVIASSTGGAATVAAGASAVSEITTGAMKRVTVADTASATGALRRFMRVRVTTLPPF